jgi:hypothetical protein
MSGPSDYDSLLRQLEELRQRAEQAEKERQEERLARQEERLGREQAEKQRQEERLAREQAEKRIQKSTFLEFLHHCHTYYTEPLGVQTDKEQSTGGTTVRPYGAYYLFKLLHWDDFIDGQRSRFAMFFTPNRNQTTLPTLFRHPLYEHSMQPTICLGGRP